MELVHTRQQMPIGQGGFHVGTVSLGGPSFNYVYDCGSEDGDPLNESIAHYIDSLNGSPIDVLFLSHLDSDHVCGLDHLLTTVNTRCAVLPYLSPTARLILIARATESGGLTGSQLSFLCNPTRWLVDRGVDTILYVTPTPSGSSPPDWTELPQGFDPLIPPSEVDQPADVLPHVKLNLDSLSIDESVPTPRASSRAHIMVVSCLNALRLQAGFKATPNWQFVTFVHPEGDREVEFRQAVQRTFGRRLVSDEEFVIDHRAIRAILTDSQKREELASCYTVIRQSRNLVSLSLYSGPINTDGVWIQNRVSSPQIWFEHLRRVGWMGTGDASLSPKVRRHAFFQHFRALASMVSVFVLPHHGSRHNFHVELLKMADVFAVAAGKDNRHGHPDADVVAAVAARTFVVTTQEVGSTYFEQLTLAPYGTSVTKTATHPVATQKPPASAEEM